MLAAAYHAAVNGCDEGSIGMTGRIAREQAQAPPRWRVRRRWLPWRRRIRDELRVAGWDASSHAVAELRERAATLRPGDVSSLLSSRAP